MVNAIPRTAQEFMKLSWPEIKPFYNELEYVELNAQNVGAWLTGWTRLSELVSETQQRLYVATCVNTADTQAQQSLYDFFDNVFPYVEAAEQQLRQKLIASGLEPDGFEVPLRNMHAQASLFREANLTLLTEEHKLEHEYDRIIGSQAVYWEDRETTVTQLRTVYQKADRAVREKAWRIATSRQLADRMALNDLWTRYVKLRTELAANVGYSDYRAYRWHQLLRFDYSPVDCAHFHDAIEQVVVPAAERVYERRRLKLGLSHLRPWDLDVDPTGQPALKPFSSAAEFENGVQSIFHRVDPHLADYFAIMRRENLLDLDNRKGKAPGGFCTQFTVIKRPFIFMNAVGIQDDVQTLLHEGGHSFHVFESACLPYAQQQDVGMEFAEVASMSMELLGMPYLASSDGGFYSANDAKRAIVQHLESIITFWPYMAVVDAFQHWVYQHEKEAVISDKCDAVWATLWKRFMRGVDWGGLEQEAMTGWQRKEHIFQWPFYYVEYGMAQLGAVQVWRNSLRDEAQAVRRYRNALSLGGTVPLPQLYASAVAVFRFDAGVLQEAVSLIESKLSELEAA
jgi:oligoendopeptidase F